MRLVLVLAALAAGALGLAACGSSGDEDNAPAGGGQALTISETEYELDPSSLQVDETGQVTIRVTNDGSEVHALEVENEDAGVEEETEELQPGESAELTVDLSQEGSYEIYCPVDGHRERGMEGTLTVGAGGAAPTTGEDETTTEDDDGGGSDY